MDTITIVKDQVTGEDVVLTINDSYSGMDICKYVMPVPETSAGNYTVVKEAKEDPKDTYHEINYNL